MKGLLLIVWTIAATPVVTVLLFTTFIANNPGFAVWLIGILLATIGGLSSAWLIYNNARLQALRRADEVLARDFRAGTSELSLKVDRLADRVTEVEVLIGHNGSVALLEKMNTVQLENNEAHARITERVGRVETEVADLKESYPSAKLDEALGILKVLLTR